MPLARALAGGATPHLVAGPNTQAALAEIGVRAATIDSTVYLPSPPNVRDPLQRDVVAHELVHVAARNARSRFYGGPLDREERHARLVGHAAASATPALLTGHMGAAAVAAPARRVRHTAAATTPARRVGHAAVAAATASARRVGYAAAPVVAATTPPRLAGHLGAAAAAATATTPGAHRSLVVARLPVVGGSGIHRHGATADAGPTLQRAQSSPVLTPLSATSTTGMIARAAGATPEPSSVADRSLSPGQPSASGAATTSSTVRSDEIDALLEALEDRVLADLERRGGRFAGEF